MNEATTVDTTAHDTDADEIDGGAPGEVVPSMENRPPLDDAMDDAVHDDAPRGSRRVTLFRLLVLLLVLPALVVAQEAGDDGPERALLRQDLALLAERPMSDALVATYEDLHERAWALGDAETAHAAVERMVAWWDGELGEEAKLLQLGRLLLGRRDHVGARRVYERAAEIVAVTSGPEHPNLAICLNELGIVLIALGELEGAKTAFWRALAIQESTYGRVHELVKNSLHNLSLVHLKLGDVEGARDFAEEALEVQEALHGPEHAYVATSLSTLANALSAAGMHEEARARYERALAIRQAALGPGHRLVADTLNNLGGELTLQGDYDGARALHEQALEIQEASLEPDDPAVAHTLNALGVALSLLGNLDAAQPLFERTLRIREASLGPQDPAVAEALGNLANLLKDRGDLDAARPFFERGIAIREAVQGPRHPQLALALSNLGGLLVELGEPAAARPLCERAVAIQEETLGPDHWSVATSLDNLGRALADLGDVDGARSAHERALAIVERSLGPEHPYVAEILGRLVRLHLDEGRPGAALEVARRLLGRRDVVRRTLMTLTEGERYLYLARHRESRAAFLAAAGAAGDTAAAYAAVLEAKGQVARLTLQSRAEARASVDRAVLALVDALADLQARLAQLALETGVRDRDRHEARLEALRAERDALEREVLRALAADEAGREERAVTAAEVAASLPTDAAVVDLLVHPAYLPAVLEDGALVEKGRWSAPRVSAWILRSGSASVTHVDLGPAEALGAALREHLAAVFSDGGTRGVSPAGEPLPARPASNELDRLLWLPLREHLADRATIFVSPDGALATLPFETVRDEAGRYLIEDHAFVSLPGGAALVALAAASAPSSESALLAAGGVDYERRAAVGVASAGAADPAGGVAAVDRDGPARAFVDGWAPLPGTASEARAVVLTHERVQPDVPRLLLEGADATEERLKAEMPGHGLLHLATHGFFQPQGLPSLWEQAVDTVEREGDVTVSPAAARLTGLHPGLLSGLVLAGANHATAGAASTEEGPPSRDDGYLTASEVTHLDLSAVYLVVLSACETAVGRPRSGEGLLGLRRAFHMAGADTVVSSLWSVEDESTSELMQAFYDNLFLEGMGRHAALRAAQLEMLARNRAEHGEGLPSTWGAFVLSGEWR